MLLLLPQVPVCFSPTTSLPKTCRLVLMSRRDGSSASAATLVFLLRGAVDSRAPLKQVAVAAPLYQLAVSDFSITNPFPAGGWGVYSCYGVGVWQCSMSL